MPISDDYSGETFVAFTDISGFKSMMMHESRLIRAMDALYSSGYRALQDRTRPPVVDGLFISDCGILFVRKTDNNWRSALDSLLAAIAEIHRNVFESAFSLTTSIAYGPFTYRGKIEFEGLDKNAIHGHAYISAFKDNGSSIHKLFPNECRILKTGLPEDASLSQVETLSIARNRIREEHQHFYFEWMKKQ